MTGDRWRDDAACLGQDTEIWFVDVLTVEGRAAGRKAKQICKDCPVRAMCLGFALQHRERHGIFGGLTVKERLDLARTWRQEAS